MKEFEQQEAQLKTALHNAKPDQIRSILQSCQSSVLAKAKSQNFSPYSIFMVDEYSADIYQAAAYAEGGSRSIDSEDKRVQSFLKARKAGEVDIEYALNLTYTVMFTRDSLSGPQKEPKSYTCRLNSDLTISTI